VHAGIEEKDIWSPSSEEEKDQVRRQMERLLETSHFKNSRRYPPLFRFIVEETLEGRGEFLKERLLGVRVFDRPADYDTATDPIVRVTIAEIRKRIAQYYHEEAHEAEMRIELLPGRYVPEFRPRREVNGFHTQTVAAPESVVEAPAAGVVNSPDNSVAIISRWFYPAVQYGVWANCRSDDCCGGLSSLAVGSSLCPRAIVATGSRIKRADCHLSAFEY
jgi:hypothetical protein